MKQIYFVRHAKSSWADPELKDHDRPLNGRGKRDAPYMADRLRKDDIKIDGVLTSTAKRARQTARVFADVLGLGKKQFVEEKNLYHAGPKTIERCIRKLSDQWDTVLIFGHNPGFTEVANTLKNDDYLGNVPTCGIVGAKTKIKKWDEFRLSDARRNLYYFPKQKV